MQIDPLNRTAHLSVRELAAFRNLPSSDSISYSPWRASVGQQWHKSSEADVRKQFPNARFEVSIQAEIRHRDWIFKIRGRIDQVIPAGDGYIFREVKTVRHRLPETTEELLQRHPDYFAQAAAYLGLARCLSEYQDSTLVSELLFIDIDCGAIQITELDAELEAMFELQMDTWIPFLEDRRSCHLRLLNADIQPAFQKLRDGQAELFRILGKASLQAKTILLEAPTGFGKTGIILEHALKQMKAGMFERCIYLTSKATGQIETIRQLRKMIGDQIRFIQMRNRNEHSIDSVKHSCGDGYHCESSIGQSWREADIHPPALFKSGTFELERARELGEESGICPYSLTKACLPYAEVWIGDSNYVFSPSSQSVFLEQHGFDPNKTLLIIDEAHNLPNRVADSLSVQINTGELVFALEELRTAGAKRGFISTGNELVRFFDTLKPNEALNSSQHYELLDLCEDITRQIKGLKLDYEGCAPFAIEIIWSISDLTYRLEQPNHEWLYWLPKPGTFQATCLDAQQWINQCIQPFGSCILMSATIHPVNTFIQKCGLQEESTTVAIGHAPWRNEAYDVAIDCRPDTRYGQRKNYYELTARTVAQLIEQSPGAPIAVFFASYQYAENILSYLQAIAPFARAQIQPRGVDLSEQEAFIDEALLTADALFLILGSSYAEGVDKLGGRIETVMVVGPALPEVNLIQTAKMSSHASLSREDQFRDVYILPAMQRIHQALGRIVRAPEHKARVVLHGKRYAESAYQSALANEYRNASLIRSNDDFIAWIRESKR